MPKEITERLDLKVVQESYTESHTDNLDKKLFRRVLTNKEGTIKVTIEQPFEFNVNLFNRGEELKVDFTQIQRRL
jgi:hypothetical protein|tara:strand:+ start:1257 stop:1481 length:225 start_codon:yes stop_codon:yes gene_type:complete